MLIDRGVMRSLYLLHKGDLPTPEERGTKDHQISVDRYQKFFEESIDMIQMAQEVIEGLRVSSESLPVNGESIKGDSLC